MKNQAALLALSALAFAHARTPPSRCRHSRRHRRQASGRRPWPSTAQQLRAGEDHRPSEVLTPRQTLPVTQLASCAWAPTAA
jgi:hypothetical protein